MITRLYLSIFVMLFLGLLSTANAQSNRWEALPSLKTVYSPADLYADEADSALYIAGIYGGTNDNPTDIVKYKNGRYTSLPYTRISPSKIVKYKGRLYAAGYGGFVRWEPSTNSWIYLDSPSHRGGAFIMAVITYRGKLLIGGRFQEIAGKRINSLAVFDGEQFEAFPDVLNAVGNDNPIVTAMAEYKGELYIAGQLNSQSGRDRYSIARFDGMSWKSVSGRLKGYNGDPEIGKLYVWKNELYVGGALVSVNGVPVNGIACWNGVHWRSLSKGLTHEGHVTNMLAFNDKLYVTGHLNYADSLKTPNIARWDGERWCAVGRFDGPTFSLTTLNNELYVGGSLGVNPTDSTNNLVAKWIGGDGADACSGYVDTRQPQDGLLLYPNPAKGRIYLNLANVSGVEIFGVDGRLILRADAAQIAQGVDVSELACAVYMVKAYSGNERFVAKLVKQ